MSFIADDAELLERRRLEDLLSERGRERDWLDYKDNNNRGIVRALIPQARAVGINVRRISELTRLSTQTLHTWQREHMKVSVQAHYGLGWPAASTLSEAVHRTISAAPERAWTAAEVRDAIPSGWPTGTVDEVDLALDGLVRGLRIWDPEPGQYRVMPPDEG